MSESGNLTIVIQAGGESRRMGRSKATVPFLGEPLLMRGIRRLLPIADEFIVTTNEPENLGFVDELVGPGKVRLVRDVSTTRGALHGIHTAFEAATKDYVSLVACDMVFPSRHIIIAELERLIASGADIAVPKSANGYEPFHGVYRRATCLAAVTAALDAGEDKATSWFDKVETIELSTAELAKIEPRGGSFINVNTPEQLHDMERKIREDEMQKKADFGS